ncbi:MAG: prepilin peptidase [Alphaproteobacteria bacterium]|nr:prepilin peptidase [Alphaproteobacteria bacterium]MBV9370511.1 prepilin peptidase [Alphaproteobacteria bacterium]MBV9901412.1 prepilin peptidase [Alphaproteobacteria bacterium]
MNGGLSWLLIALLAGLLGVAAVLDWRSRTIPNWLNLAIAALALPFWYASGLALWPDVAIQVGVAAAVLLLFGLAFHFGMMGGGDVKMLAALALWLPIGALLQLLVIMSLAGGVLTLAVAIPHRVAKAAGRPEIPYGIAISFAGLWLIGERILNQFV